MDERVILRGFRYSVYTRIVGLALYEKGVSYTKEEINPFAANVPEAYLARHPFGRVPVLSHSGFDIYETMAITRYVDVAFEGPELMPEGVQAQGRVVQVQSLIDSYGYLPMIRQVFAQRVFATALGETADEAKIATGLGTSDRVLQALDRLAAEGLVLNGERFTLADCHLAPMMAYFVQAPEGAGALAAYPALSHWWRVVSERASLAATDPGLPTPESHLR